MTNLDKLLKEFKEARSAASKSPWSILKDKDGDAKRVFASDITGCDEDDETYSHVGIIELPVEKYGYGSAWASEPNGEFICLAANNSDKLIRILEVMGVALKQISENKKLTIMNESDDFMEGAHAGYVRQAEEADEALQQAEKIAGDL